MDRAKADADRARLLDDLLDVLADPAIPDDQAGRITYACNLGYAGMAGGCPEFRGTSVAAR